MFLSNNHFLDLGDIETTPFCGRAFFLFLQRMFKACGSTMAVSCGSTVGVPCGSLSASYMSLDVCGTEDRGRHLPQQLPVILVTRWLFTENETDQAAKQKAAEEKAAKKEERAEKRRKTKEAKTAALKKEKAAAKAEKKQKALTKKKVARTQALRTEISHSWNTTLRRVSTLLLVCSIL